MANGTLPGRCLIARSRQRPVLVFKVDHVQVTRLNLVSDSEDKFVPGFPQLDKPNAIPEPIGVAGHPVVSVPVCLGFQPVDGVQNADDIAAQTHGRSDG